RSREEEVSPVSKSKPYSAVSVNSVLPQQLTEGRPGQALVVGCDIGKFFLLAVPRWADGAFGRPGRVRSPEQIKDLVSLLKPLATGRNLRRAMEPSGAYGDPLRPALACGWPRPRGRGSGIRPRRARTPAGASGRWWL